MSLILTQIWLVATILMSLKVLYCSSEKGTSYDIWPIGDVPGMMSHDDDIPSKGTRDSTGGYISAVHIPSITHYPATVPSKTKTAIIVLPGGGYSRLAYEKEGTNVAKWMNKRGVVVFVLKYRHRPYQHPYPLQDSLQAIRYVRGNMDKFDVDPTHVGVMGFSAGGHLASCAATLFGDPDGSPGSLYDDFSPRPDFVALIYPVISMDLRYTHIGSRNNLLGNNPKSDLMKHLSTDLQVSSQTPPAFIVHTGGDETVMVENSILFYKAMQKLGLQVELHLYADGPHGLGMKKNESFPVTTEWPRQLERWLRFLKFMDADDSEQLMDE